MCCIFAKIRKKIGRDGAPKTRATRDTAPPPVNAAYAGVLMFAVRARRKPYALCTRARTINMLTLKKHIIQCRGIGVVNLYFLGCVYSLGTSVVYSFKAVFYFIIMVRFRPVLPLLALYSLVKCLL